MRKIPPPPPRKWCPTLLWLYLPKCHLGRRSGTGRSSCILAFLLLHWGRSQGDPSVGLFQNLKCLKQQWAFHHTVSLVKTQRHVLAAKAPLGSPRNGIRGAASVWITSTKSASVGSSRTSSGVPWKLASTGSNPKRDDQCCRPIDRAVGTSRSTVYSCSGYALLNSRDAILWSHAVPWPCLVSIGTESFSVAPQKRAPVAWIEKGRWAKRFKFVWPRIFPLTLFSPIHLQIFLL